MVVLVLLGIFVMQGEISYSTAFGKLDGFVAIPGIKRGLLPTTWLLVRSLAMLTVVALWIMNRQQALFKAIIVINGFLTLGLVMNLSLLTDVLFGISSQGVDALLIDVVLLAVSNILIFSVWYWIIDPPGVEEARTVDEPWDFLFPQRARRRAVL